MSRRSARPAERQAARIARASRWPVSAAAAGPPRPRPALTSPSAPLAKTFTTSPVRPAPRRRSAASTTRSAAAWWSPL